MHIASISDFRRAMRNGPYAWPGGYPMFFVTNDGAALSFKAANQCRRQMLEALAEGERDHSGWLPVALEVNWEDTDLTCDHTGERIESAYGEAE